MLKKIKYIKNLAVFKDFDWDTVVKDKNNIIKEFTNNNIFYGRNYSGKTTLSRIARALETGEISDKYKGYEFTFELDSGTIITQNDYQSNKQNIRVFNEDFIDANLPFYSDDGLEPFAVLGEDNGKIEAEIKTINDELGSDEEGAQSNLYKEQADAVVAKKDADKNHKDAKDALDNAMTNKATGDRNNSIKYKSDLYGDQNYDVRKLEADIAEVTDSAYKEIDQKKRDELTKTVTETELATVSSVSAPQLKIDSLKTTVKNLIEREIGKSDKIQELVNDAILNRWVQEGMTRHEHNHDTCAFCGSPISDTRWHTLEQHFDEESKQLEADLNDTRQKLTDEKTDIGSTALAEDVKFYTSFHTDLASTRQELTNATKEYIDDLDVLLKQVDTRLGAILMKLDFQDVKTEYKITETLQRYNEEIVAKANEYTSSITTKKANARKVLRLDTVNEFVKTIDYSAKQAKISELEVAKTEAEKTVTGITTKIKERLDAITEKQRQLDDKSAGAGKVNEYLNHFFGHKYLSLEPVDSDSSLLSDDNKEVRFEIQRNGNKAYHLSEGEKSLIAFCYFIAKLEETGTNGSKPIVWIDDPISSLDQNHIYFIYSLMKAKVLDTDAASQLFISTHNLDFLRYIKNTKGFDGEGNKKVTFFIVERKDEESAIKVMPEYMRKYVTEFTHIFSQIYECGTMASVEEDNYKEFYGFANNARKFLEMYLFYKYPGDKREDAMTEFFGDDEVTKSLVSKFDNDNSHAEGATEKTMLPYDIAEAHKVAQKILEVLRQDDRQYKSLLKSVGIKEKEDT
jgi:wobble nucleotide-excising tRNase